MAVAPDVQKTLGAKGPIVVTSNDTMRRKVDKHAPVAPESFGLVQEIVDLGETIDEGRGAQFRTFVHRIDGQWWKLVLARSAKAFLRVQTLFGVNAREVGRLRRKGE